jgi:hypothetical protein
MHAYMNMYWNPKESALLTNARMKKAQIEAVGPDLQEKRNGWGFAPTRYVNHNSNPCISSHTTRYTLGKHMLGMPRHVML